MSPNKIIKDDSIKKEASKNSEINQTQKFSNRINSFTKNSNIFKIDEEMLKIKTMDVKNKIMALKPTSSRTVSHFDNHNQHKVSLKNSLNKNNTYSKFEINISESKEDNIKDCNLNKMTDCTYKEKREIQINFLVHKEEWINKKRIL